MADRVSVSHITDDMVEVVARALAEAAAEATDTESFRITDTHRRDARDVLVDALAGCTVATATPEHDEQQWQVTVSVPMRLDGEDRQDLFNAIVTAVANWEPDDRDGWDADVYGNPAQPPNLADQLREWADILLRGTGDVPAGDVAWKLRQLADGRAGGSQVGDQHG